jgi:hypothetical protein
MSTGTNPRESTRSEPRRPGKVGTLAVMARPRDMRLAARSLELILCSVGVQPRFHSDNDRICSMAVALKVWPARGEAAAKARETSRGQAWRADVREPTPDGFFGFIEASGGRLNVRTGVYTERASG